MSSKRGRFKKKSPIATPPDITYTKSVNCQWDTCMQQFSCIAFLAQHVEKAHILKEIKKDYVCLWRDCKRNRKPFADRYTLVTHLRIHTREKPDRCPYQGCNETFSRRGYLKLHIQRQHTGEKPYKCQVHGCNKSFHVSSNCSRHQKTHFKERKPFPCTFPGCDKTYSNNNTLRRHSILKHPLITKFSKVEVQTQPLIAAPPEQHPYHDHTDNRYLQLPLPEFMINLPAINTIFDAQELANYLPSNSHYTDTQSHSNIPYQSPQLDYFSQYIYNPQGLVLPSLSSMTLSNNLHFHTQSS